MSPRSWKICFYAVVVITGLVSLVISVKAVVLWALLGGIAYGLLKKGFTAVTASTPQVHPPR